MKKKIMLTSTLLIAFVLYGIESSAEELRSKTTEGNVTFTPGASPVSPVDPENPEKPVIPQEKPNGTGGSLSIDYASQFKFGSNDISTQTKSYYAQPDIMQDETLKPTYIQVTDRRGSLSGWKLKIAQTEQFKTKDGHSLEGAQLNFTKGKLVSLVDEKYKPSDFKGNFNLEPDDEEVVVIQADEGTGPGTWVFKFGNDVKDNEDAVQLNVPGKSVKLAKEYETSLTWTLENTP